MRITSWNVNGIRAALRHGGVQHILSMHPDVLCLQEIKARPEQLSRDDRDLFDGYRRYWHPAERAGYSGVATLMREEVQHKARLGVGVDVYDVEGRVITTDHGDFQLFNVYFPNGGRDLTRLQYKLDFYAHLLDVLKEWMVGGAQVIVCGDFNTAHCEIDLRNPKQNEKISGFLPEEREWIDRYLDAGLVDAYRCLYPEREEYTWWTYRFRARERNIGWRLDYFLVSEGIFDRVKDVTVHGDVLGSDHCPVSLELLD